MKRPIVVFAVLFYLVLLSSCSVEEIEQPTQHPLEIKNDYSDAMMQRDSVSKEMDEIDPPVRPKPSLFEN